MSMHHHHCAVPQKTPASIAAAKINRRTILKATAAFTAAAATAGIPRRAPAQTTPGQAVLADAWIQPDNVGGTDGHLQFQANFPFHAIAPHWPGETDFAASVELQTSADGERWSDPWVVGSAHTDAGPTDRDNRTFGELSFTDTSEYVRYRTLNADGTPQGLPGLEFTYIDATGGPSLGDISTDSPVPSLQRPPIISRAEWGASLTYGGAERGASEWIPEYQTVQHIIIHHAETPNFHDPLAEIRAIHYYHAITRGWGDIGYNYLVDFMGNVYEGRVGGDNVVGGHAYQYAYGSSGICAMGNFSLADATPEMLAGLIWITAWTGRALDPLGRADFHEQPNLPTICGHRDVNDSSCPGDALYADLDYIREAVAEVLAGARDTIPNPQYSPGEIVQTITDGANLRAMPGTSEDIIASLPYAAVFQVIQGPTTVDDYAWYQVQGDWGSGWLAAATFGSSDAAPPVGRFAVGDALVVREDMVNIRQEPSLRGGIVATIPFMTAATVVGGPMPANGYTWYQVQTEYGTGWCVENMISQEEDVAPPVRFVVGDAIMVAEPDGIRLRATPSISGTPIGSLRIGETGTIIDGPENASGYAWMKVRSAVGTGWVAEEFLDAAPSTTPPAPKFATGDVVQVDPDYVNFRNAPGAESPIIGRLPYGTVGTVISTPQAANNIFWAQLETSIGTGWAAEQFLLPVDGGATPSASDLAVGDTAYVNTDALNVRDAAGLSGTIVTTLTTNATATVIAGPTAADGYNWYQLSGSGISGWAVSQYLGKGNPDPASTSTFSIGDVVTSSDGVLNMRSGAGIDAELVSQMNEGDVVTVLSRPEDADGYAWVHVTGTVSDGWVVTRYLTQTEGQPLKVGDRGRVFDGELNLRAAASLGAEIIAVLPDATFVDIIDGPIAADGEQWYRVSTSRYGTGWCSGRWLVRA